MFDYEVIQICVIFPKDHMAVTAPQLMQEIAIYRFYGMTFSGNLESERTSVKEQVPSPGL